jgi:ankyrin repeat protein
MGEKYIFEMVNTWDMGGRIPLMIVIERGNIDSVDVLLFRGADYRLRSHNPYYKDMTAIDFAAK